MNKLLIKINNTDLASRTAARKLRLQMLESLSPNSMVSLDLSSVESVSDSFADELFGVLSAKLGLEEFFARVSVVGAKESVSRAIAVNIRNRTRAPVAA